jgi:hypothetical protein
MEGFWFVISVTDFKNPNARKDDCGGGGGGGGGNVVIMRMALHEAQI